MSLLEGVILAGFIVEPDLILPDLEPIFNGPNREVYKSIMNLHDSGEVINAVKVAEEIGDRLEKPMTYVGSVLDCLVHTKAKYIRRDIRDAIRKLQEGIVKRNIGVKLQEPFTELSEIKGDIESAEILHGDTEPGDMNAGIEDLIRDADDPNHIALGIERYDNRIGGFRLGELLTIMGRPTTFKTWFMLNILKRFIDDGRNVGFFSLEMPLMSITERLVQLMAPTELARDNVAGYIKNNPDEVRGILAKASCASFYTKIYSVAQIQEIVDERRHEIVMIDFFGLIRPSRENLSPYERASATISEIKAMAKDSNVFVALAVQLSRGAEDGSIAVKMNTARDSGVVEELSDFIIGMWRPEISSERDNAQGIVWTKLLKNKRGENYIQAFRYRQNGKMDETVVEKEKKKKNEQDAERDDSDRRRTSFGYPND